MLPPFCICISSRANKVPPISTMMEPPFSTSISPSFPSSMRTVAPFCTVREPWTFKSPLLPLMDKVPDVQITFPVIVIEPPTFTLQLPLKVPPLARSASFVGHCALATSRDKMIIRSTITILTIFKYALVL